MKDKAKKSNKENKPAEGEKASAAEVATATKVMTPEEKRAAHVEGIVKTAVAAFIGIFAGIMAFNVLGIGADSKWYAVLVIVAILAYYAQRLIFPKINIDTKEFGMKDWFYVEFIVIDFCLVTWTLLLN
ncbi:EMC6-like membrane protein [Methanohalophilus sp.]